ncbi:T9SS type A sorting domain-containing protein [Parvicella tangerina]|uniref:Secretion system C-terminal sorting domain-containing protein n=1 Tax=Parvicella tangerina TaxID=2829795 RepID=A0A916NI54_9FLAO|nr:T9SS type A sorting domain-containing protein [Parvicella tangerina]CAG5083195.1 hypothetical protein CRYO30217_02118 [Parvicella tangerina]
MKYLFLLSLFWYGLANLNAQQNQNVSQGLVFDREPYLAVDPQNSQHIVVAWMGYKFNELVVIKTRNSTDGGDTWSTTQSIPHFASGNQSADPSIQFDHLGNVYICYIDYNNATMSNGAIYVTKSTDGGNTWNTPVEVISIADCPNKYCIDRPWMEIDRTNGPNQGTIYVTSMNADRNVSPPYNPYLSVSTDGGASFQTPRYLDTINYLAGDDIDQPMPTPAIGTDGTFYAVYPSYVTAQSLYATLIMASSTDGGNTLDHKFILYGGSGTAVTDPLAKKASLLITDDHNSDHLAMIILAQYNGDADIFLSETYDKGQNWSTMERVNQDVVSNGVLQDLVWGDFNADGDLVITWRDRRVSGNAGYEQPTEIFAGVRLKDTASFHEITLTDQIIAHDTILNGKGNDFMCAELIGDTLYAVWGDARASSLNIYMVKTNIIDGVISLSTVHETKMVNAFPNPATDYIRIEGVPAGEKFAILDINGKTVKTGSYYNHIDVNDFKSGVYFVLFSTEQHAVVRFVVE